jgi:hypothetical protein
VSLPTVTGSPEHGVYVEIHLDRRFDPNPDDEDYEQWSRRCKAAAIPAGIRSEIAKIVETLDGRLDMEDARFSSGETIVSLDYSFAPEGFTLSCPSDDDSHDERPWKARASLAQKEIALLLPGAEVVRVVEWT